MSSWRATYTDGLEASVDPNTAGTLWYVDVDHLDMETGIYTNYKAVRYCRQDAVSLAVVLKDMIRKTLTAR